MEYRQADDGDLVSNRDNVKKESGRNEDVTSGSDGSENGAATINRRGWLTAMGVCVAGPALATRSARAADQGYGAGGYGEGPYGGYEQETEETALGVATGSAVEVNETSATLSGELTELVGHDSATAYIRWGVRGGSLSNTTSVQTLESIGTFDATVTGLDSATEYEFQAYVEAGDESATGTVRTFTTDESSSGDGSTDDGSSDDGSTDGDNTDGDNELTALPEISVLRADDVSNPKNPHVDVSIQWGASIPEGELAAAKLTVSDESGDVLSWTYDLAGQTAERSESDRIKHGAKGRKGSSSYVVELSVQSGHGTSTSAQTSL